MASAFWTLEDGRSSARGWAGMAYMLELITDEWKTIQGAEAFYDYLEKLVFREENGDEPNGFGGFIRSEENFMLDFDLRTFAPRNRAYFWQAAQMALAKLNVLESSQHEVIFCSSPPFWICINE